MTTHHQLRGATSVDDWKMTPSFETINFQDDRIAWLAVNVNMWRCTWRTAWPPLAWFVAWLLIGRRAGIADFVWQHVCFQHVAVLPEPRTKTLRNDS